LAEGFDAVFGALLGLLGGCGSGRGDGASGSECFLFLAGHLLEGITPSALFFGFLSNAHGDIEHPAKDDDDQDRVADDELDNL
jgi:hypothetical protein